MLPTSTDLVTDLPADFDVALQGVDTRLKALQPGTTLGDLAYSSATANTNTRLPIGTSGQVLAVSGGGVPAWTTTADVTPLTTKGDLFTFTTVDARIGVGADGTVLTADSAEATGLKWATASSGGMTLISTTTLSGVTTTLSSIPSTYNDLIIQVYGVTGNTANSRFSVKPNNANNCDYLLQENATSGTENDSPIYLSGNANTLRTNANNAWTIEISNYASATARKPLLSYGKFLDSASADKVNVTTGIVDTTSAISSLVFQYGGTNTFAGGTVLLYGVK